MAKITSILGSLRGSSGDQSFYPSKYGNIVRTKGGPSRKKIRTEPNFVRVRENNNEFGMASTAGRVLRHAVLQLSRDLGDGTTAHRLTSIFRGIACCDLHSIRGQRQPQLGLQTAAGSDLLRGFSFNSSNSLRGVLSRPIQVDSLQNMFSIPNFNPAIDCKAPFGTTHLRITAGIVGLDLGKKDARLAIGTPVVLALNGLQGDVSITVDMNLIKNHPFRVYLLKLEFMQEVNGVLYPLKDKGHHVLEIVEVVETLAFEAQHPEPSVGNLQLLVEDGLFSMGSQSSVDPLQELLLLEIAQKNIIDAQTGRIQQARDSIPTSPSETQASVAAVAMVQPVLVSDTMYGVEIEASKPKVGNPETSILK